MTNEYGFTNDPSEIERVRAFRDAAVVDGWTIEPAYGTHESVETAAKLHKDDFVMMILARGKTGKWNYEAHISMWGPDGLAIRVPKEYDWAAIQDSIHICTSCGKHVETTHRYSFAGRCCEACLPEMRKTHEYPGWCD